VHSQCGTSIQGLSVGWGNTYGWSLPEQWIDIGGAFLASRTYVLRSIADPRNKLYESASRSHSTRESAQVNEATTVFTVKRNHSASYADRRPATRSPHVRRPRRLSGPGRPGDAFRQRDDGS
jgi:hypothetical protein